MDFRPVGRRWQPLRRDDRELAVPGLRHLLICHRAPQGAQIDPQNVKSEQRKLRRLVALAKRGERTRERVDASYQAWRQHASKGNNWKLLQRMDKYYINLLKGVDENEDHETGTVPGPASGA